MTQLRRIQLEDFKNLLNQEIEIHSEIEANMDQKKDLIIKGDMDGLMKSDNQIEKLVDRARELEQERIRLMVEMGKEGETLQTFIKSLHDGEDRIYLEKARAKLLETVSTIKEQSTKNRELLTQSIRFIEQSVNVIASLLAPEGASYNHPGQNRRDQSTQYRSQSTLSIDA